MCVPAEVRLFNLFYIICKVSLSLKHHLLLFWFCWLNETKEKEQKKKVKTTKLDSF